MRQSSATSKHLVDRSIKSASIKQRKAELDEKFSVAFGYLMDANEAYLAEKRRTCNQRHRQYSRINFYSKGNMLI